MRQHLTPIKVQWGVLRVAWHLDCAGADGPGARVADEAIKGGAVRSGGHFTRLESERDFSVGVREAAARGATAAHARAPRPTPRAATLATYSATIYVTYLPFERVG